MSLWSSVWRGEIFLWCIVYACGLLVILHMHEGHADWMICTTLSAIFIVLASTLYCKAACTLHFTLCLILQVRWLSSYTYIHTWRCQGPAPRVKGWRDLARLWELWLAAVLTTSSEAPEQVHFWCRVAVGLSSSTKRHRRDRLTGAAGNCELQRVCSNHKPVYRRHTGEDKNSAIQRQQPDLPCNEQNRSKHRSLWNSTKKMLDCRLRPTTSDVLRPRMQIRLEPS